MARFRYRINLIGGFPWYRFFRDLEEKKVAAAHRRELTHH